MNRPALILRADADGTIGTGHVLRCFALAETWRHHGGHAALVTRDLPPTLGNRFRHAGIDVHEIVRGTSDLERTCEIISSTHASWVALDGYTFTPEYVRSLQRHAQVLSIEDYASSVSVCADLVVNGNSYAIQGEYGKLPLTTKTCLGSKFAILRREFSVWGAWKREIPRRVKRVFLSLGGGESGDLLSRMVGVLTRSPFRDFELVVALGAATVQNLKSFMASNRVRVRVERDLREISKTMAIADLAVSAAGSTTWELACMGVPSILLVRAENQQRIAEAAAGLGFARNLGTVDTLDLSTFIESVLTLGDSPEERGAMSTAGRTLVDGRGAERVCESLVSLTGVKAA